MMTPKQTQRMRGRGVTSVVLILLSLFLVACSRQAAPTTSTREAPAYLLTLPLGAGDSPAALAAHYGATIITQTESFVILGLEPLAAQSLQGDLVLLSKGTALEPNSTIRMGGERISTTGTSRIWAGGTSRIWAGGTSRIWAGGTSRIWAGGTSRIWAGGSADLWEEGMFAWLPENTALWGRIRLQQGQTLSRNLGLGVKVAVIDTGIDLLHPALSEALAPADEWWDFYGNDPLPQEEGLYGAGGYGHGTNVAGIVRQVAPRATILPLRVLGSDGSGSVSDLAAAIVWATDRGAQVINLSLGSAQASDAVETALRYATSRGALIVASVGNSGDSNVTYPASSATNSRHGWQRLSVTSVDLRDARSSFSAYSTAVEVAAPGEVVYGPAPDMQLAAWTGTSMAAPMAAGALALALGDTLKVPAANLADEVRVRSADIYNNGLNEAYKDKVGKGRLNLEEFLRNVIR